MVKNLQHNEVNGNSPEQKLEGRILEHTSQYKVPFAISKEEALRQLKNKIASGTASGHQKSALKIRPVLWTATIAATMLLLFGVWYLLIHKPLLDIVAGKGQHTEYQLPDGSQVSLNAESKISYDKNHFIQKRLVHMDGEAFFKIRKGKTFTITTDLGEIQILGTSFNVFARDNNFKVTCITGKVRVRCQNQSTIIIPGESVAFENKILQKYEEKNINTIVNWRNGEFHYEDAALKLILNEIERQYNVTFVLPDISNKFFTGSFSNKNLVDALDIVCIPMGLTYEIGSNGKIIIREKQH
jgi:transmembrane sensor